MLYLSITLISHKSRGCVGTWGNCIVKSINMVPIFRLINAIPLFYTTCITPVEETNEIKVIIDNDIIYVATFI